MNDLGFVPFYFATGGYLVTLIILRMVSSAIRQRPTLCHAARQRLHTVVSFNPKNYLARYIIPLSSCLAGEP